MRDQTTGCQYHFRLRGLAAAVILTTLLATACGGSGQTGEEALEDSQVSQANGAGVPEGLDIDAGVLFAVEGKGDLAFEHTGGAICEVYQNELMVSFLQTDDPFLGYELRVDGFSGDGSYHGTVTLERNGVKSTGPVELDATVREGDLLPQLTSSFSGTAAGALGSTSLTGTFQCATDLGDPSAAVANPTGAWIEYAVSGDASAELREPDVMICGRGGGWRVARPLPRGLGRGHRDRGLWLGGTLGPHHPERSRPSRRTQVPRERSPVPGVGARRAGGQRHGPLRHARRGRPLRS